MIRQAVFVLGGDIGSKLNTCRIVVPDWNLGIGAEDEFLSRMETNLTLCIRRKASIQRVHFYSQEKPDVGADETVKARIRLKNVADGGILKFTICAPRPEIIEVTPEGRRVSESSLEYFATQISGFSGGNYKPVSGWIEEVK